MLSDPHFNARGLFETVEIDGKPLKIPALLPRMSRTPGSTRWPGADLGSANQEVLGDLLGLDEEQISELRAAAVIL
jgi:crotonobetainyl-CoA:carnitine CoA-transferase CaiB-like acyl-CoA transferase